MSTAVVQTYSQKVGFPRLKPSNFFSLWSFENNLIDSIGSNDLTQVQGGNNYPPGLIGDSKVFSNNTLEANNDMSLSFTDGVNDIEGGFSMLIRFNSTGNQWLINKRDGFGESGLLKNEHQLAYYLGNLQFVIFDQVNGGYIIVIYSWTPTLFQDYHIQCYYDGSGLHTGLKMYIDGISVGTTSLTGTYVSNQNYNTKLVIGSNSWNRGFPFYGRLDEIKKSKIALTDAEALELATKELSGIKVI